MKWLYDVIVSGDGVYLFLGLTVFAAFGGVVTWRRRYWSDPTKRRRF
jgi:hypothetical protein